MSDTQIPGGAPEPMSTTNKRRRRRTCADGLHVSDLPIGFLVDVSAYLSKPSRALFAVAMTAPSSFWRDDVNSEMRKSATSQAIVSSTQWEALDFVDIEKKLAKKLSDDDVGAILTCINAKQTLKTLKLTGCVKIRGNGLEPLRDSAVLEQIDLSIVDLHEMPEDAPDSCIYEKCCLPILESIIASVHGSLKHVQFPQTWIGARSEHHIRRRTHLTTKWLSDFLERFNQLFISRTLGCSRCDVSMGNCKNWVLGWPITGDQPRTCYSCTKHFCNLCVDETGQDFLRQCGISKKYYCSDCVPVSNWEHCPMCGIDMWCSCCEGLWCEECGVERLGRICSSCLCICECCGKRQCYDCAPNIECENCERVICEGCSDGSSDNVRRCDDCCRILCSYCRAGDCKVEGKGNC